jgi:uncharacterized membrane protein
MRIVTSMPPTDVSRPISGPSRLDLQRHLADAVLPNAAFLVGYEAVSASVGVIAALVVALALAALRLLRRRRPTMVAVAFGLVLLHAATVLLTGEGRGYFLPWLLLNGALTLVFATSLLIGRPITRRMSRFAGLSDDLARHRLLTAMWAGFWVLHLAVGLPLYLADMVVALGVASFLTGPPGLLVMGFLSWRLLRRTPADEASSSILIEQPEDGSVRRA